MRPLIKAWTQIISPRGLMALLAALAVAFGLLASTAASAQSDPLA